MLNVTENLAYRLRAAGEDAPHATFCTFVSRARSEVITYEELLTRSASYATQYMRLGIRPGDLIIIVLKHSPHLFYSFWGAILAGAVPSFMPFPSPKQRPELYWSDHERLFDHLNPKLLVTYDENVSAARQVLSSFSVPCFIADDMVFQAGSDASAMLPGLERDLDSVACLQHSSGTTGLKKGVMLTHRAILDEVSSYGAGIGLASEDRIASWLPLYHDMGFIACFMSSVITGAHLISLDPFEWVMRPTMLLDTIEHHKATLCWLPNFAFSHIVNRAKPSDTWDLSSIRAFINCSEPCKPTTFERFAERFASSRVTLDKLQVCYAMAENVFGVTQTRLGKTPRVLSVDQEAFARGRAVTPSEHGHVARIISCGPPIDGVRVEVRAADGNPVQDCVVGEICISGRFLFNGYYKQAELTARRLRDGWYSTGDVGFMEQGELFVTGRLDDLLILNGRNYYAHEIEAIASTVEGVVPGRVVAVGIDDERTDATVAVLIIECPCEVDYTAVSRTVRERILQTLGLSVHAVRAVPPGRLVKTTSGKISRNKNRDLFVQGAFK